MPKFEIEIKSLLGSKDNADGLLSKMKTDPSFKSLGAHKQLNHYFIKGDLQKLSKKLNLEIPEFSDYSARTRWADGKVILVIKGSIDDTTSSNGTARREFEKQLDMTIEELDKILLECGFEYQAKWSRERQDYKFKNLNVSVDKNAGYGYLAEFESVIEDQSKADETKGLIREIMKDLQVEELNQDRLARMFDYYNKNWQDYYGTEKVFNIE